MIYRSLLILALGATAAGACGGLPAIRGEEQAADDPDAGRARRLEQMKRAATQYRIFAGSDRGLELTFVENPALRWTNPVNAAKDGTVFLWTARGRPQAIVQFYTFDEDRFNHEWQSLAETPLTAESKGEPVWTPAEPGVTFRVLEPAASPAATPAARLRQMKGLAAEFSSTFRPYIAPDNEPAVELRLLPQPLFRYESEDAAIIDGALFAFVQGTDPQSLLLLEARAGDKGRSWHYAFARLASGALTGSHDSHEVWSVAKYDFRADPRKPFLLLLKQPAPVP